VIGSNQTDGLKLELHSTAQAVALLEGRIQKLRHLQPSTLADADLGRNFVLEKRCFLFVIVDELAASFEDSVFLLPDALLDFVVLLLDAEPKVL
jgi:hypothetical protein